MSNSVELPAPKIADAHHNVRHLFIRDLVLDAKIGVLAHEKISAQQIRINVHLSIAEGDGPSDDSLASVVCYRQLVEDIKEIVKAKHINLVETLAERIAESCLNDSRVLGVRVSVEKLCIIDEAASVGVEIERLKPPFRTLRSQ